MNIVVVCRLHNISNLKQELNGTKAYEETSTDVKSVADSQINELPLKFSVSITTAQVAVWQTSQYQLSRRGN